MLNIFYKQSNETDAAVCSGVSFKAPPYNTVLELKAIRENRVDSIGVERNLITALSEIYRVPLGMTYEMYLDDQGKLRTIGSNEPLEVMYAPERQVTDIDRIRSPFDIKGVKILSAALKDVQLGLRNPFSWIMISPSYGIGSGFVMIEIGKVSGNSLLANRLVLPTNQFGKLSELEILKKLGYKLSENNYFKNAKGPLEILGEVIFRDNEEDLVGLIDQSMKEILGKEPLFGMNTRSLEETFQNFSEIIQILQTRGAIPDFLSYLAYTASLPFLDIKRAKRELDKRRNILINQFLDLKEIQAERKITEADIENILAKKDSKLTRDASGFCVGSENVDAELEAVIRKVGYDSKGRPRAFRCPSCHKILIRKTDDLLSECYLCDTIIPRC